MTEARLTATIGRGPYGLWFARTTGTGYAIEYALTSPLQAERRLGALVADGFAIADPLHYCDIYGVLMAEDEPVSQYEDSRDAAESPGGYIGSVPGDNGRDAEDALEPDYICIGPGDSARVLVDDELVGNWEGYDGRDDSEY